MNGSLIYEPKVSGESRPPHTTARRPSVVRQAAVAYWAEALCCLLLLLMAVNFLIVIQRKSITVDEAKHIPAGYHHLVHGNFRINNEHPPLVKMLAALPLVLLVGPVAPAPQAQPTLFTTDYTEEITWPFWKANTERFETISFWSRVPMIALTLLLGALIFIYARRLFGPRAALFAVALFSFEPTVLAHGRVVQTDVPAALGYLLFFFALHTYGAAPTTGRALFLGLAGGLALLTKFSMIVIVPVLAVATLALIVVAPRRGWRRTRLAAQLLGAALVAVAVINAAYYFQRRPLEPADVKFIASQSTARRNEVMLGFRVVSKIVPTDFLYGIYWQIVHSRGGHSASLLGDYSRTGWWYYFPVAFALKTTLAFALLSAAALVWAAWRLLARREKYLLVLVVPLALYTALIMTSKINIGIRYFLPAFPFLFILSGAFLDRLLRLKRARSAGLALAVLALCWVGVESVRAYPHYMSYMNQLAWQHPRWYYLSDSNVEWGDDVRELALYLRARGETKVRARFLGGWGRLEHYGVEYVDLLPPPAAPLPETRYIAIGASYLNGSTVPLEDGQNYFAEYRRRTPEKVFGNSIYLYRAKE
ncbi:MAG: glycosyltransferase family 39 protein [Pyrinomonadaceae bacterium]|nr:glycosyltransferase family 39 protein [Pyrinomonadaceae bacterium]